MADFALTAEPFLGGYSKDFDGVSLNEVTDLSLISIAQPLGGQAALTKAAKTVFATGLPSPGTSASGKAGQIMGMGPDQYLAMLTPKHQPAAVIKKLGKAAYCTDQSDNWVGLRITGPATLAALERICPINISPAAFPKGSVARTTMEHLGAIIISEGDTTFLLLSASSSAGSFLHAVTTSIENTH